MSDVWLEIPRVSLVDNEANIILWNIEQSVSFTRGGDRRLHACYTLTRPTARKLMKEPNTKFKINVFFLNVQRGPGHLFPRVRSNAVSFLIGQFYKDLVEF